VRCFHFWVEEQQDKHVLIYAVLKLVFVEKVQTSLVLAVAAAHVLMLLPNGLKLLEASSGNFVIFKFLHQCICGSRLCKNISNRGRWSWQRFTAVSLGGILWIGFLFDVFVILEWVAFFKGFFSLFVVFRLVI